MEIEFEVEVEQERSGRHVARCPMCSYVERGFTADGTFEKLVVHINAHHDEGRRVGHA